jgi:hypothetical protein
VTDDGHFHGGPLPLRGLIPYWKNSSNACFFRKRDSTASWVAGAIWQQHFEESKVPNPNFCKF